MRSCPLWFPCRVWGKQSARASWRGPARCHGPAQDERDGPGVAPPLPRPVEVAGERPDGSAPLAVETDGEPVVVLSPLTGRRAAEGQAPTLHLGALLHEPALAGRPMEGGERAISATLDEVALEIHEPLIARDRADPLALTCDTGPSGDLGGMAARRVAVVVLPREHDQRERRGVEDKPDADPHAAGKALGAAIESVIHLRS